jgi:trk system potassium uptake protein TrkH
LGPIDAFFESMSGLTTTGSTVITGLDDVLPSVLVWRALLQFLGGMGIIVLSVALISRMTQGGMQMLQAESPGPSFNRIAPRLASTARILWSVYLIMSATLFVILAAVLYAQGFDLKQTIFESLVHTMTTISTGGFSSHDASIGYFDSWLVEGLLIIFMLVSGVNYALHFHLLKGEPRKLTSDPEWRFFIGTYLIACLVLMGILWNDPLGGLRAAAFTAASLVTSTGFATVNYDAWPEGAKMVLLLLMVTGASSGSTGGGLKIARVMLIMQLVRQRIRIGINPRAIIPIRVGHRVIKESTTSAVAAFFVVFIAVWLAAAFILLVTDSHFTSILDAASASITALSNMGPGFGVVGPTQTFADLNSSSKLLLSLEMWFGRLEIFSALIIFSPEAWRH